MAVSGEAQIATSTGTSATALLMAVSIAVAPAMTLGPSAVAAEPEARREMSRQERRMIRVSTRDQRRSAREFDRIRLARIKWGQEKEGSSSTVVELDPPLPRIDDASQVDVEVFVSFVDNAGGQKSGWRTIGVTAGGWRDELHKARLPVRFYAHHPRTGAYLDPEWDWARGHYQDLVLGWGRQRWARGFDREEGAKRNLDLLWKRQDGKHLIATQEDAERVMWANWLPLEAWKASLGREEIQELMGQTDRRWSELAVRGSGSYAKAFKGIADPILLINGKYLITANTARRQRGNATENVYRLANWLLRREIENLPKEGRMWPGTSFKVAMTPIPREPGAEVDPSAEASRWRSLYEEVRQLREGVIDWGEPLEPEAGQVVVLEPGVGAGSPGHVTLEWFYTYITRGPDGGDATGWLSNHMRELLEERHQELDDGIRSQVRIRMMPLGNVPGEDERWSRFHAQHQRMALGWGMNAWIGLSPAIDQAIRHRLSDSESGWVLGDHGEAQAWVERQGLPVNEYDQAWNQDEGHDRARSINARFRDVLKQGAGHARDLIAMPRDPVLLVDGKFLVHGATAGGFRNAVQIAVWMVQERLKEGDWNFMQRLSTNRS